MSGDSAGSLNAAGIILVLLFTCILLWKFGKDPIEPRRLAIGILSGLVCAVVCTFGGCTHACGAGIPISQWFVPSLCAGLLIATVDRASVRRSATVVITVCGTVLCYHFVELVHEPGCTGSPTWEMKVCADINNVELNRVRDLLRSRGAGDATTYPAGWLDERPLVDLVPDGGRAGLHGRTVAISLFWHSWFTGLYHKQTRHNLRIWYPGGTLLQAVDLLEFRQPPESVAAA